MSCHYLLAVHQHIFEGCYLFFFLLILWARNQHFSLTYITFQFYSSLYSECFNREVCSFIIHSLAFITFYSFGSLWLLTVFPHLWVLKTSDSNVSTKWDVIIFDLQVRRAIIIKYGHLSWITLTRPETEASYSSEYHRLHYPTLLATHLVVNYIWLYLFMEPEFRHRQAHV